MPRYHDRDHFYKYVTKDVAKLIIKNHSLRWSCPVDFNDPFDDRYSFIDESRLEAFFELIVERFETYVWERNDIQFDEAGPWGSILAHFKRNKNSIPRAVFRENVETIKQRTMESGRRALSEFNQETERTLMQTRVLCLAEENNNLLMWSHYASAHTPLPSCLLIFNTHKSILTPILFYYYLGKPINLTLKLLRRHHEKTISDDCCPSAVAGSLFDPLARTD